MTCPHEYIYFLQSNSTSFLPIALIRTLLFLRQHLPVPLFLNVFTQNTLVLFFQPHLFILSPDHVPRCSACSVPNLARCRIPMCILVRTARSPALSPSIHRRRRRRMGACSTVGFLTSVSSQRYHVSVICSGDGGTAPRKTPRFSQTARNHCDYEQTCLSLNTNIQTSIQQTLSPAG